MVLVVSFNVCTGQDTASNPGENYIKQIEGKLDVAKERIDRECVAEETANDPLTWYLKAYIYTEIAKSAVYKNLSPDASIVALDAIKKHLELDRDRKYYSESVNVLLELTPMFYNSGIIRYNSATQSKNSDSYAKALKDFENYFEAMEYLGSNEVVMEHLIKLHNIKPSAIILYAGYSAQNIKDYVKAKNYYKQIVLLEGEKEKALEKGQPLAYIYYSNILEEEKNINLALQVIERGRELWPENYDMTISAINLYRATDRINELTGLLEKVAGKNPKNIDILVMLADNYNKRAQYYKQTGYDSTSQEYSRKAIETYLWVLQLDPADKKLKFNMNFKTGVLYYNPAVRLYKKHDPDLTEEYYELFNRAVKYFEAAHSIDSTDRKVMDFLLKIYQILEYEDKAAKMKAKLGG